MPKTKTQPEVTVTTRGKARTYEHKDALLRHYIAQTAKVNALLPVDTWVAVTDDVLGSPLGVARIEGYVVQDEDVQYIVRTEFGAREIVRPEDATEMLYVSGPYQLDLPALVKKRLYPKVIKREWPGVTHYELAAYGLCASDRYEDERITHDFSLDTHTGVISPDYLGLEPFVVYTEAAVDRPRRKSNG